MHALGSLTRTDSSLLKCGEKIQKKYMEYYFNFCEGTPQGGGGGSKWEDVLGVGKLKTS